MYNKSSVCSVLLYVLHLSPCFLQFSRSKFSSLLFLNDCLVQPALDDKEDEVINEEIVLLERGLHEQVIFHALLNYIFFLLL